MKLIYGEVGSGKTSQLIEDAYKENAIIITYSGARAQKIIDKAMRKGKIIHSPIVVNESSPDKDFIKELSSQEKNIIIDNVECTLKALLNWEKCNIIEASMTSDKDSIKEC